MIRIEVRKEVVYLTEEGWLEVGSNEQQQKEGEQHRRMELIIRLIDQNRSQERGGVSVRGEEGRRRVPLTLD